MAIVALLEQLVKGILDDNLHNFHETSVSYASLLSVRHKLTVSGHTRFLLSS